MQERAGVPYIRVHVFIQIFIQIVENYVTTDHQIRSLLISTTEETHETHDIGLGLWPLSDLCIMKWCTGSLYRDVRPLRGKAGICPHNPN
jgi:hypothetical protein